MVRKMTDMEKIRIYCKNTQKFYKVNPGTSLEELRKEAGVTALAAHVDNQLKELLGGCGCTLIDKV